MAAKQSPVIVQKKGFGCCGCGCLFLGLLALLLIALIAIGGYEASTTGIKFTSSHPSNIPTFDSGEEVYNSTMQKLVSFGHDVNAGIPATLRLSTDEINTLIAHDPEFSRNKVHAYFNLTGNQSTLKSCIPTDLITSGYFLKGRYLNSEMTFGLTFDPDTKTVGLDLKNLRVGNSDAPGNYLPSIQTGFNTAFDRILKQDPASKAFLDKVSSIRIDNSELVLESK